MFARKKKIGSNLGVMELQNRLLRLLRSDTGFQAFLISPDRTNQENASSESQKDFENAMLEAEYKKAKAFMTMQRHPNFC
jgi:7,8-dihydro-6-hydroxymethylpterin-pyrophosphokinase